VATIINSSRSPGRRLGFALAAAMSAGISVFLIANDFVEGLITGLISLLPAIFALAMVVAALKPNDAGSCCCPRCGATLSGLALTSNAAVLCGSCHTYFEGKDRSLWEIDPDRVAGQPLFRSQLPEHAEFPDVCCVCGAEGRRKDEILLTTRETESWQSGSGGAGETHTWKAISVSVPHCEDHTDGAILGLDSRLGPYIRFRSYPYLRAFCQLNGTQPE
jgi:hypothetical protein